MQPARGAENQKCVSESRPCWIQFDFRLDKKVVQFFWPVTNRSNTGPEQANAICSRHSSENRSITLPNNYTQNP